MKYAVIDRNSYFDLEIRDDNGNTVYIPKVKNLEVEKNYKSEESLKLTLDFDYLAFVDEEEYENCKLTYSENNDSDKRVREEAYKEVVDSIIKWRKELKETLNDEQEN